jgi:fructan beta-fructosidase
VGVKVKNRLGTIRALWRVMSCFSISALFGCGLQVPAQIAEYNEPYRPQIHFSPRQHWTNDPNGLVYFRGEYHMFFQFNPFGDQWGHMSWGHAVSMDLLHWHELPVAIPEKAEEMVFTGSVVVDSTNSSGFCGPKSQCLVAIYTGHRSSPSPVRQTQNLAYSLDNGRTWTRYVENPVIDLGMSDFRDPSVLGDSKQGRWLMAVSLPKQHKIRFYASSNLRQWTQLSDFGPAGDVDGDWECPDLLAVPSMQGSAPMWALKIGVNPGAPQGGSGEQYFLGNFDGSRFTASSEPGSHGWTNYGKDDYCAISFNGLSRNEKPVLLGWMDNWLYAAQLPTSPWRGQMSLPRRLSLIRDEAGLALQQEPVLSPLRGQALDVSPLSRTPTQNISQTAPFELDLQFDPAEERLFGLRLYTDETHWTELGFDRNRREFYMDRTKSSAVKIAHFSAKTLAPLSEARPFDLRLVVDRSSIEAYAQNGTILMTNLIFPASQSSKLTVFSASGKPVRVKGSGWKLRTIWK